MRWATCPRDVYRTGVATSCIPPKRARDSPTWVWQGPCLMWPAEGGPAMTRAWMGALVLGATLLCGCSAVNEGDVAEEFSACPSKVTKNVYDGPNYWGTIT